MRKVLRTASHGLTKGLSGSELLLRSHIYDWLCEESVAKELADAAFAGGEPDWRALAASATELGYDPETSPVDFAATASEFVVFLRAEIQQAAKESGGAVFNRWVVEQLAQISARLADGQPTGPRIESSLPPRPKVFVGRERDVALIRERLRPAGGGLAVVRGWPGVGKSTLAAEIAHDPALQQQFPEGVLWAGLSEETDVLGQLHLWCRRLGLRALQPDDTVETVSHLLAGRLRAARMLLIVDDAWRTEDARPFLVGGRDCGVLVTTRLTRIAQDLDADNYPLGVLDLASAVELMAREAPHVVAENPAEMAALADRLEGLPLALRVAARLLAAEHHLGFGVADLLQELSDEDGLLLEEQAPPDRADLASATTPTIAALLRKSTDRLPPVVRSHFSELGVLAARPATFDLVVMADLWQVPDARPSVRVLVDRGLLEPSDKRFQLHALLHAHARQILDTEEGWPA